MSGQRTGRRSRHEETKVIQNQCKQANGRFGHVFRDMAIKEFITVIRGHIRENDILGRNRLCLAV